MRRAVLLWGYLLVLTGVAGFTVWQNIRFETQVASRAAALRVGKFLIPLPLGTQVIVDGGRVHCHLIIRGASERHRVSVAYVRGTLDELVQARRASGWSVSSPLQENPALSSGKFSTQSVVFSKPGRQLGYHFVNLKHAGDKQTYLVIEWLCDESECADVQNAVEQLLRQMEVQL